jgi:hypothetical protein
MAFRCSLPDRPSTRPWVEPVLVDVTSFLRGIPVWLSCAAGGTLVHSVSVTVVAALDAVVRGVGLVVSRRLP